MVHLQLNHKIVGIVYFAFSTFLEKKEQSSQNMVEQTIVYSTWLHGWINHGT